jgi:hypothetical protein
MNKITVQYLQYKKHVTYNDSCTSSRDTLSWYYLHTPSPSRSRKPLNLDLTLVLYLFFPVITKITS